MNCDCSENLKQKVVIRKLHKNIIKVVDNIGIYDI